MHKVKNVYGCNKHSNNNDWLKAIRKTKKDKVKETQDSIKFGVNLRFKPRLSSVYFFHLCFRKSHSLYGQQKGTTGAGFSLLCSYHFIFVRPCPHRDTDYGIGSNFWKFYLIKTGSTLSVEPVSLVKVFRLFRLEWIFFGVQSKLWTQEVHVQHLIYWQGQCVCDALFQTSFLLRQSTIISILSTS
jgi:hypothetical protein